MDKEEFDMLPSDGKIPCPDCNGNQTMPYGGCSCRDLTEGKKWPSTGEVARFGFHINKYHHACKKEEK